VSDGYSPEEDLEAAWSAAHAAWGKVELAQRLQRQAVNRAVKAEDRIYHARIALRLDPPDISAALEHLEDPEGSAVHSPGRAGA
jgi:hypothetical protein